MWHAHGFHQFNTGNRRGTRTIADDLDSFHVAASQMQRVNQPRRGDDGGTVLVIINVLQSRDSLLAKANLVLGFGLISILFGIMVIAALG